MTNEQQKAIAKAIIALERASFRLQDTDAQAQQEAFVDVSTARQILLTITSGVEKEQA